MPFDCDVVIDPRAALLPFGIDVGLRRQRLQGGPVQLIEQLPAAGAKVAGDLAVEPVQQRADGGVYFPKAEELPVAQGSGLQIASQQHVRGVGAYPGIDGRIKSDWVGASDRNHWARAPGIRTRAHEPAVSSCRIPGRYSPSEEGLDDRGSGSATISRLLRPPRTPAPEKCLWNYYHSERRMS